MYQKFLLWLSVDMDEEESFVLDMKCDSFLKILFSDPKYSIVP